MIFSILLNMAFALLKVGLQTMFEQLAFTNSSLYLSFDSSSKNTLRFGWTRLGVSRDVANFLVSLDEDGHTIG